MMQNKSGHYLGLGHRNIQRRGITKIEDERKKGRKDGLTEIPFLELSPETRAEGRAVAGSAEVKVLADVGSIILFSLDTVF